MSNHVLDTVQRRQLEIARRCAQWLRKGYATCIPFRTGLQDRPRLIEADFDAFEEAFSPESTTLQLGTKSEQYLRHAHLFECAAFAAHVCFGVTAGDMRTKKNRMKWVSVSRQLTAYWLCNVHFLSADDVCQLLNLQRSSVHYCVQRVRADLEIGTEHARIAKRFLAICQDADAANPTPPLSAIECAPSPLSQPQLELP